MRTFIWPPMRAAADVERGRAAERVTRGPDVAGRTRALGRPPCRRAAGQRLRSAVPTACRVAWKVRGAGASIGLPALGERLRYVRSPASYQRVRLDALHRIPLPGFLARSAAPGSSVGRIASWVDGSAPATLGPARDE